MRVRTTAGYIGVMAVLVLTAWSSALAQDPPDPKAALARAKALGGGVACVPRCGQGDLAMALAAQSNLLVLALDSDLQAVSDLKKKAADAGYLGRNLLVEEGSLESLPFADNYVDVIALPDFGRGELSEKERAEIMRALTPIHGRTYLKDAVFEKGELPGSDWWTHKLHRPNNNSVSKDTVFSFPPLLQFRAMPMYNATSGHRGYFGQICCGIERPALDSLASSMAS